MKNWHFLIAVLLSAGLVGTIPSFAQTSQAITVTTDKAAYSDGDHMVISGTIAAQLNVPISIIVKDPGGNIVLLGQTTPNPDNTYSAPVTAGGDLWTAVGTYQVYVTYGSKANTASTSFQFSGTVLTAPISIEGQEYNATYKITNAKLLGIVPDTSAKSLTIRIQPIGNGTISINLPRSLIDSKAGGQDTSYVVEEDGKQSQFNQTNGDSASRTLQIQFGQNTSQITIIGTQIVPEFSSLSVFILGIGMTVAVLHFGSKPSLLGK